MRATYFDGKSALAREVDVSLDGDYVVVAGDGVSRRDPIAAVQIPDAIGSAPGVARFVDGASLELSDNAAFAAILAAGGRPASRVSNWEGSWRSTWVALAVLVAAVVLGYRYGLPVMAESVAMRLPASTLDAVSAQTQRVLDGTIFSRTHIDGRRLASLLNAFDALELPAALRGRLRLEFRDASTIGANALALPSGVMIVTDQLVALTGDDRLVMAVIAHEAGHVDRRHGLRQIIQSSTVAILMTWFVGDVSSLAAAAPTALMEAKYSRDLEREADAYAVRVLRRNGIPPSLLADMLELIAKSHGVEESGVLTYLSSHPATTERLAWLRAQPR